MTDRHVNAAREYARYRSIVSGDPYLRCSIGPANSLPKDGCIISHDGSLTATEKRVFGRNPFITPGRLKSDILRKPANPLPCLYLACTISERDNIPLSKLTIGHMQDFKNRISAIVLAMDVAHAINNGMIPTKVMHVVWNDMRNNGRANAIPSTLFGNLGPEHELWRQSLSRLLIPSEELIKAREKSGWGEW